MVDMKQKILNLAKILCGIILTGIGVTITYAIFERVAYHAIPYIWEDVFNTNAVRIAVIPVALALSLVYFWLQHHLDPISEQHESHGLGEMPKATLRNFAVVLILGFLSLLAGATLGVESILVPASLIIGSAVGVKLFKKEPKGAKLLGATAFIALFAAFFHSFIMGILALYLLAKTQKIKVTPVLLIVAAIASLTTIVTLHYLPGESGSYLHLPSEPFTINFATAIASLLLLGAGYATTYAIHYWHKVALKLDAVGQKKGWVIHALIAGAGIAVAYLIAGPLVQFTGNLNIVPMLNEASNLGIIGLVWLAFVKTAAIGWSKALHFRGGLIFPTVFVASTIVAIVQFIVPEVHFTLSLIVVMVGTFIANSKLRILF